MKTALLLSIALLLLSGCSSLVVTRDYDPSIDFSPLKTYAWQHDSQPQTGNPRLDNDLLDRRIREAVDLTLSQKGYEKIDAAEADFLVAYHVQYKQRIGGSSVGFGMGVGNYGRYGGASYSTSISDYDEGHLTLDFVSGITGKTVWRGVGIRNTYEASSPEKITRIVNKAVSGILAKFPPER